MTTNEIQKKKKSSKKRSLDTSMNVEIANQDTETKDMLIRVNNFPQLSKAQISLSGTMPTKLVNSILDRFPMMKFQRFVDDPDPQKLNSSAQFEFGEFDKVKEL